MTTESPEPRGEVTLPIACSLEVGQGSARAAQWNALHQRALVSAQRDPGRLLIRYLAERETRRELEQLILAERECCAFAGWTLRDRGEMLELEVVADTNALDALSSVLLG